MHKMAAPNPGSGPLDGWNDPPMLHFNATSTPPSSKTTRLQLNKRVSFPLNTSKAHEPSIGLQDPSAAGMLLSPKSGPLQLPPVHILPPSASTTVNPPVPLLLPLSPPIDHSLLPPSFVAAVREPQRSETLPELLERLELDSADALRKYTKRVLHEMVDICKESIQGRSRGDVQARLSMLDDQWRDGKLSEGARIKLGCLASALQQKDLKQADCLHLALMVDHISEVSQWMVGVKWLITELKQLTLQHIATAASKKETLTEPDLSNSLGYNSSAVTQEDVCLDTVQFSNLKPILLPEDLLPQPNEEPLPPPIVDPLLQPIVDPLPQPRVDPLPQPSVDPLAQPSNDPLPQSNLDLLPQTSNSVNDEQSSQPPGLEQQTSSQASDEQENR
ncbi:steroid receptor RNA activator 1-like [Biomphalaria glabrata]|uniref:Steroid receptor RNA activator 1-like n=1 Tax=Biomphalaria glabrata TaxID=6526 RepID=A0A9U8DY87_BIOGL|nr:steroid receptor RNA activator 1-like [Biomphalaria glabrata]KAI8756408.1 translation initiation factor IF-2-like [Biomphalaria glabrata]